MEAVLEIYEKDNDDGVAEEEYALFEHDSLFPIPDVGDLFFLHLVMAAYSVAVRRKRESIFMEYVIVGRFT